MMDIEQQFPVGATIIVTCPVPIKKVFEGDIGIVSYHTNGIAWCNMVEARGFVFARPLTPEQIALYDTSEPKLYDVVYQ